MAGEPNIDAGGAAAPSTNTRAEPGGEGGTSGTPPSSTAPQGAAGTEPTITPEVQKLIDAEKERAYNAGKIKGEERAAKLHQQKLAEMGFTEERWQALTAQEKAAAEAEAKKKQEAAKSEELFNQLKADHERQLAEERKAREAEAAKTQRLHVNMALTGAVAKCADVLPSAVDQVTALISPKLGIDGDQVVVLDEKGEALIDKDTYKPMTVDRYVAGFVASNPHFQRPKNPNGGSGSTPGRTSSPSSGAQGPEQVREAILAGQGPSAMKDALDVEWGKRNLDGSQKQGPPA